MGGYSAGGRALAPRKADRQESPRSLGATDSALARITFRICAGRMTSYISGLASDVRVLYNLARNGLLGAKGDSHKERLESFYGDQAGDYDAFRKRLLTGREELMADVAARHGGKGGIWVDMGGGTGANLEMMGDEAVMTFAKVYVVDLCGPLLEVARKRAEVRGWHNVEIVEADATTWVPPEGVGSVDVLSFSYSLTMIPDWYAAIDHACQLLSSETGLLGVADFYVARKHPPPEMAAHSWLQRTFWPTWFALDDVRLNPDHLPFLQRKCDQLQLDENGSAVPYIGLVLPKVPCYRFIGTPKPQKARSPAGLSVAASGDDEDDEPPFVLPPSPPKMPAAKKAGAGKKAK